MPALGGEQYVKGLSAWEIVKIQKLREEDQIIKALVYGLCDANGEPFSFSDVEERALRERTLDEVKPASNKIFELSGLGAAFEEAVKN